MLGFQGSAQPSPALGDAINAGYRYLEVKCLRCNTHQTVALDNVRRPKTTPIHELETCGARIARAFKGGHTSEAISWRCGRPKFPPAIRHQHGGRWRTSSHLSKTTPISSRHLHASRHFPIVKKSSNVM
jgi:hypothetical protein